MGEWGVRRFVADCCGVGARGRFALTTMWPSRGWRSRFGRSALVSTLPARSRVSYS
jgi:hypothetical protein